MFKSESQIKISLRKQNKKLTKNKCDFGGTVFSTVLETQYVECALGKGLAQHVT